MAQRNKPPPTPLHLFSGVEKGSKGKKEGDCDKRWEKKEK